jgi:putative ABC transport system permease protein
MRLVWSLWLAQLKRRGIQFLLLVLLSFIVTASVFAPMVVEHQVLNKWSESAQLVDVVIGRKGSPMQIVASSLYRIENPTGNLSEESATYWRKHPMVSRSCAISLGDNIDGYPIVGVDSSYYSWMNISLLRGGFPAASNELVVPLEIAEIKGWQIGDELFSAHGDDARGEAHHHHGLKIVGVVEAERASDQSALFVPTEAYTAMHHDAQEGSVTAMLLELKSKSALVMLPRVIDAREDEQGAFPVFIFAQLQKQWQPTFEKIKSYGIGIPAAIGLMFLAFATYLGRAQQPAATFLKNQKTTKVVAHMSLYGLYAVAGLIGWAFGVILANRITGSFDGTLTLMGLTPLVISQFIHLLQARS